MHCRINAAAAICAAFPFWCHVPASYDAKRKKPYPVLVYFGGRNCAGKDEASGKLGWSDWADANGAFTA